MELNLLQRWEIEHRKKILRDLKKAGIELIQENIEKIIEETSFEVRKKKHPDECPYYENGAPCHPEVKNLNCFLCSCPQYISKKLEGGCKINSKHGKWYYHNHLPKGIVWDCSDCKAYHNPKAVEVYLKKHMKRLQEISANL